MSHDYNENEATRTFPCMDNFELEQLKVEKNKLLNELKKGKLDLCYSCARKTPAAERALDSQTKQKIIQLKKLREEWINVSDEYGTNEKKIDFIKKEIEKLHKDYHKLEEIKNEKENYFDELKKYTKELEERISLEEKKHVEFENKLEDYKNKNNFDYYEKEKCYLREEKTKLIKTIDTGRKERDAIEFELGEITKYSSNMRQEIDNKISDLKEMRRERNFVENLFKRVEHEWKKYSKVLEDKKIETEQNKFFLAELDKEIKDIKNEILIEKENKEKMKQQEEEAKKEVLKLHNDIQSLKNVSEQYLTQKNSIINEIENLEEQIKTANISFEEKEHDLRMIKSKIEQFELQITESRKLHIDMRAKIRKEFLENRSITEQCRQERQSLSDEMSHQQSEVIKSNLKLNAIIREETKLINELKQKNENVQNLKDKLSELKNEVNEINKNYQDELSEYNQLKLKYDALIPETEVLQEKCTFREASKAPIFNIKINKLVENILESFDDSETTESLELFSEQLKTHFLCYLEENCKQVMKLCGSQDKECLEECKEESILELKILERELEVLKNKICDLSSEKELAQLKQTESSETLCQIEKKTSELSDNINELKNKVFELEGTVMEENEKLKEKRNKMEEIQKGNFQIESEIIKFLTENEHLKQKLEGEKTEVTKHKSVLKHLVSEVQQLQNEIDIQRKKKNELIIMYNQERSEFHEEIKNKNPCLYPPRDESLHKVAHETIHKGRKNPYPRPKVPETPPERSPYYGGKFY